jgi:hypothetical protein
VDEADLGKLGVIFPMGVGILEVWGKSQVYVSVSMIDHSKNFRCEVISDFLLKRFVGLVQCVQARGSRATLCVYFLERKMKE